MNIAVQKKNIFSQPITEWTWAEKYRHTKPDGSTTEFSIDDTHRRVVEGVFANDPDEGAKARAFNLMTDLVWCPAGRIHAGAGTDSRVTLINCFVSPDIEDSMQTVVDNHSKGIADALNVAMFTQQMGGGIGMDFSTLRPDGSVVRRTNSVSTGPLPFMGMWDAMCVTIKSSGARRGAMMGVMHITHPDVRKFIVAKRKKGVFENFNVSVLVTDAFMDAVKNDEMWDLKFHVPRADGNHVDEYVDEPNYINGWKAVKTYVYERIRARDLWDEIIQNTYEWAEPGVLFIDVINRWNNLHYAEYIHATNPCGEQPLPPDGDCNLGAINLAPLVINPFKNATFNWQRFEEAIRAGVRFLDNVLDISQFPTEAQREEALAKRRTGLGITALGNCLQMMKMVYGNHKRTLTFIEQVMSFLRDTAYDESVNLAIERGPFPLFDKEKYLEGEFIKALPKKLRDRIAEHGIRNAVILTIAPTGTTSLYYGNVSSGLEPTFSWKYNRKVRQKDGSIKDFGEVYDYGYLAYKETFGEPDDLSKLPDYMVNAFDLRVEDHLAIQSTCQKYIDSSISKTINCPADMDFEDFKDVYRMAYEMGCKGCTTYRPSDVRGSVLSVETKTEKKPEAAAPVTVAVPMTVEPRLDELDGSTYKVKWPGLEHAFYITINNTVLPDGSKKPFEIFINSKSVKHQEWISALTRMISAIFRRGGDVTFIIEELSQVHSSQGGAFVNKKFVPSLVALIGSVIEKHFYKIGLLQADNTSAVIEDVTNEPAKEPVVVATSGEICPSCSAPTLTMQEGCKKCGSCGFSECG